MTSCKYLPSAVGSDEEKASKIARGGENTRSLMQKQYIYPLFFIIALFGLSLIVQYFSSNVSHLCDSYSLMSAKEFWQTNRLQLFANHSTALNSSFIPQVVHQTWKTGSLPPAETLRWRQGCQALNPQHIFHMYDDDYLHTFVQREFSHYRPLFTALSGVYMADMARFLLAYHYGGVYMDMDFYCHRPLACLEQLINKEIASFLGQKSNFKLSRGDELLVVSREPLMHAQLLHNKSRVVIQDFIYTTPKHPFLAFMLDYHFKNFTESKDYAETKPFSYSIENSLDAYYTAPSNKNGSVGEIVLLSRNDSSLSVRSIKGKREFILELKAEVLHGWVDYTNGKLRKGCQTLLPRTRNNKREGGELVEKCRLYLDGEALFGKEESIMVHMWTHSLLGWTWLRGIYKGGEYRKVEKSLPPTSTCPS